MQEPMQCQDAQLGGVGMSGLACLTTGHASGNDDVTQVGASHSGSVPQPARGAIRKRQHVCWCVLATVLVIERSDAGVGHERDCHLATRLRGSGAREPPRQAAVAHRTAGAVRNGDAQASTGARATRTSAS